MGLFKMRGARRARARVGRVQPVGRLLGGANVLGFQEFKGVDFYNGHVGVKLFFGLLVVVLPSGEAHAYAVRYVADPFAPDELVQADIKTNVGGSHGFGGELFDLTDGTGGLLFEPQTVQPFVKVDGVVTGDHIWCSGGVSCLWHDE